MERLQKETFKIVDQGIVDGDAWYPFAWEEVIMEHAVHLPLVHIWRHPRAFIAGLRDRRLPFAEDALAELRNLGYSTVVRNSGGAAVPLHAGVVNVSVIFPKPAGAIEIDQDFAWMADFLSEILAPLDVCFSRGEVVGSYCPGDFDLSIGGRKFCGIAQRRRMQAYSLQAFVIVEGDGSMTGRIARQFYDRATGGRPNPGTPRVNPDKMASLHQLTGHVTVDQFMGSLMDRLHEWGGRDDLSLVSRLQSSVQTQIVRMRERYDR